MMMMHAANVLHSRNGFVRTKYNTVISAHCSDSFSPLSFPRLFVNLLIQFVTLYFIMILSFFVLL